MNANICLVFICSDIFIAIHSANIYWIPILFSARSHSIHILWDLLSSSRNVCFSTSLNVFTVSLTIVFSSESLLTYLIFNSLFQLLWALANINTLAAIVLASIFSVCLSNQIGRFFSSILFPRYKQNTESTYSPPKKMLQCSRVVGDKLIKTGFWLLLPCPKLSLEFWIGLTLRVNLNVVFWESFSWQSPSLGLNSWQRLPRLWRILLWSPNTEK